VVTGTKITLTLDADTVIEIAGTGLNALTEADLIL
jgi:hypothetical protein